MNNLGIIMMVFLLTLSPFSYVSVNATTEDEEVVVASTEIAENTLRIHYQRDDNDFDNWGLWTWGDVKDGSDNWPSGATPFIQVEGSQDGYVDIELASGASQIGFLVVNRENEAKDGGDKSYVITSADINEIWITQGSDKVYTYEPVNLPENTVRIHYVKDDGQYDNLGLWTWDDVVSPSANWPSGATPFDQVGRYGAYVDINILEDAKKIGFLVVNRNNGNQSGDMSFSLLEDYNQLFIKEGDQTVYISPFGDTPTGLISGEVLSTNKILLNFTSTKGLVEEELLEQLQIKDREGNVLTINSVTIKNDKTVEISLDLNLDQAPFEVTFDGKTVTITSGWRMIDEMYGYTGELGATLHADGTATIKLWSPTANDVAVILYDKDDQNEVIGKVQMTQGDRGVWEVTLNQENTGLVSVRNYFYHYEITHGEETVLALDPYAKSMATWDNFGDYPIGKAAIVNPSAIGPQLDFAQIEGFEKREDAIIYEVHVRDFTVDPSIESDLNAQFGTFTAFIDKLDYIEDLGVTHIQLLPVMSYFWGNEFINDEREMHYSAQDNNYNWGYDPHSYFSLSGMYSDNPDNPERRIEEFKILVDEIHKRGMGVILDVVYNHTARVEIFEDLVPNYYHFMDSDGTPRTSFGGGRLGTTHEMARRILVDSITYWVDEYKVDGFRFDMMGDHDAESIQIAYDKAKELNPNIVMIGEGWRTFVGDEGESVMAADQDWMQHTESVGVFSDEFRNELKSGFGSEGQPRFITGGARNVQQIFDNIKAQPHNFVADDPGDVVPYIEAHDNLTLHDVIAQSIKKDPEFHQEEIHQRIRLGNAMVLTSQGTAFIHAGQEFGRTKQWRTDGVPEQKETYMVDENGNPFTYPYFIHDSYDSTDIINMFNWEQATNEEAYPINHLTREYTTGLIELRRSTDAFRLGTKELVDSNVTFVDAPEINERDLVVAYRSEATDGTAYYVFVNADMNERTLSLEEDITSGIVLVDSDEAGVEEVSEQTGFEISAQSITIEPLTTVVIKIGEEDGEDPTDPVDPADPVDPVDPTDPVDPVNPEDPTNPVDPVSPEKPTEPSEPVDSEEPTDSDDNENPVSIDKGDKEGDGKGGGLLPSTATNIFNLLLVGIVLLIAGAGTYIVIRRKRLEA